MNLLNEKEIWKDIKGYSNYQISNFGIVKSKGRYINHHSKGIIFQNEKIMKTRVNKKNGYVYVNLCVNGKIKGFRVHRLVAQTFIDNPYNKPFVNHKDLNKQNNEVNKLEWVTQKENIVHSWKNGASKVSDKQREAHRIFCQTKKIKPVSQFTKDLIFIKKWDSQIQASKTLGISKTAINNCVVGRTKTVGGFIWR